MKICITAKGEGLDAQVDPRFGRCAYFVFVDTENGDVESVSNGGASSGGAGIQAAQIVIDKEAEAVLSGSFGPNAFEALNDASIKTYSGVSGSVSSALSAFKEGSYTEDANPSAKQHNGLN